MNAKFLVAIISIMLALGLVGCGGGDSDDDTSQQNDTEVTTPDQETGEDQADSSQQDSSQPSETGDQLDEALVEQGMMFASAQGCIACHSSDGAEGVGPTWLGLYGSERTFADGTTATADEAYLRQSILDPNANVVEGYNANIMTTYESLEEMQITALIEYIKSLAE